MEDDLKYVFGLTDDADQSGVVDQTEDEEATDEGVFEEEDLGTDEEVTETETEDTVGIANQQQTREMNQAAAAARRAAEQQLREANQKYENVEKEMEVLRDALKKFGYAGTPEEIADALEANRTGRTQEDVRAEREQEMQRIEEAVAKHPDVIKAQEVSKQIINQRNQDMFARELSEISKINPDIKQLSDLRNLGENQKAFDAMIKGGMHIDEAYKIIAGNQGQKKTVKQQDTKSHIRTVNGIGNTGAATIVPREERNLAREFGMTDKEIDAWYRRNKK